MLLKSIELQGFKSFPDKTVLQFDRGATVVIGPNGSGKSNLSDAMKWVLGELSSRNLRGSRMEDVIFGGTDTRRQMGYAEVSVTFDNNDSDGMRLSSDYDEVTVTRRYYRAGESEYYINKKPVRLKDIHELFMNTGIGREGYSIIGQGRIAEIISQKGEERRTVFEEAAGISKYRFKKMEAEKKLLGVEENLLRVRDILSELTSRVGPLAKDAEKARIYLGLYEEKKQLDVSLWLYDMEKLRVKIDELQADYDHAKSDYDRADEELTDLEGQSGRCAELSTENKAKIESCAETLASLTEARMTLQSDIKVLQNEIFHIDERLGTNAEKQEEREAFLKHAREELAALTAQREKLEADTLEAERITAADTNALEHADALLDDIYRRATELENEMLAASSAQSELQVALSVLENTRQTQGQRRAELDDTEAKAQADLGMLESRCEKATAAAAAYRRRLDESAAEAERHESALAACDEKRAELAEEQNRLYLEETAKRNRITALSRMEELFEGYSRSVRFIMNEYGGGKLAKGTVLYGPVSQLISVDTRYATAIETAFGASIQNIVVENEFSAKAAIRYLKEKNGGRATFYPIETVRPNDKEPDLSIAKGCTGYLGAATSLVRFDSRYSGVIRSMIGRILVADNIENAAALAKAYQYRIRVVTLDGQQVNTGGSFTGGSLRQDSGMLTRSAEMEKLRADCEVLKKQQDAVTARLAQVDRDAEEKRTALASLQTGRDMTATLEQAELTQLEVMKAQMENDRKQLAELTLAVQALDNEGETYRAQHEALSARLLQAQQNAESLVREKEKTEAARVEAQAQTADLQRRQSRDQVEATALRKDTETARDAEERMRESIENGEEKFRLSGLENSELKEKRAEAEAGINRAQSAVTEKEEAAAGMETERRALQAKGMELEARQSELRDRIQHKNREKELLFRQFTRADSGRSVALETRDKQINAMFDEYELTLSAAMTLEIPPLDEENQAEAAARQAELKGRIKALGTVHVGAIEEYTTVKERYDFLSVQVEDLESSKEDLAAVIYKLEEEMRTRFTESFEQVNTAFKRVFRELFGGGHAELVLTEPENVLTSGIQINVAPPGKIIKNLMLLSGGEQAFIAIALYFALLCVNPAPFCILDEIEAALDEVNVDKFADYLKRHSDKTQYIVITHRRGTMEIADRLYGVTMQERGISKILSINMNEVGKYIN